MMMFYWILLTANLMIVYSYTYCEWVLIVLPVAAAAAGSYGHPVE